MSCILPLLPVNLQKLDLYQRIDELICLQDNLWTDEELLEYLYKAKTLQRGSLEGSGGILSWFSMEDWLSMKEASWDNAQYGGGPSLTDIGEITPIIPTESLWSNLSKVNQRTFVKDGFALWNHMLEPYMGTNLIQRILLETLKIDGKVVDWYDDFLPVGYYSFVMEDFPGWDKVKALVETSQLIKNAESKLASLKDYNCKSRLLLSHGFLDLDYLSDIYGETYNGAFLCFENISKITYSFPEYYELHRINRHTDGGILKFWEIFELSDTLKLDWGTANKIYRTYNHERVPSPYFKVVQFFPSVIQEPENDWTHGKTWEDYYSWKGIEITELVRQKVIETGPVIDWDPSRHWEGNLTWTGDLNSWSYHKPGCDRCECTCEDHVIPGYEPGNGISMYYTTTYTKNTSETV